jgi:nucleotide-binding universal stress UspA family protein
MTAAVAKGGRVVVGIDGSEASLNALAWAAREAGFTGARLEVLATWEWPNSLGWSVPVPDDFDPESQVRSAVDDAVSSARDAHPGLDIVARVVHGHPAPILVEASKGADLLVVGSRGHGEFVGMLIGSVSEFCATNAHCPVLVHRASA